MTRHSQNELHSPVAAFSRATRHASTPKPQNGRCARCGREIQIEPDCIERTLALNSILMAQGQPEITKNECALCDGCYPAWQQERSDEVRKQRSEVEYVCSMIREGQSVSVAPWMLEDPSAKQQIRAAQQYRKRQVEKGGAS